MLIASEVFLFRYALKQKHTKKYVEWAVACSFLIPIISTTLYLADLTPWKYDLTPVFLCITCIILTICTLRYNYLQFLPAATSYMVDEMRDAFVVLDADGCFINANAAAKRLFKFLETARFGTQLFSINEELRQYFRADKSDFEFSITGENGISYYKASVGYIKRHGQIVCTTFVYYDITETKNLINELNKNASYDALTGIYNRGTLMTALGKTREKAKASNLTAAVFMLDIDHFKNINDNYGHQCGDYTLKEVASRVRSRLRQTDVLGRYGGEEFCVAILNVNKETAFMVAESIRNIIGTTEFEFEGIIFPLTMSIGISLIAAGDEKSIEETIAEADSALYEAKKSGRNRCIIYDMIKIHA
jgi:diguanylate cyclase (GGDEF)-like protein